MNFLQVRKSPACQCCCRAWLAVGQVPSQTPQGNGDCPGHGMAALAMFPLKLPGENLWCQNSSCFAQWFMMEKKKNVGKLSV